MSDRLADDHLLSQLSARERLALCLRGALRSTGNDDFLLWCSFFCVLAWMGAVWLDLFWGWRADVGAIGSFYAFLFSFYLLTQFTMPKGVIANAAVRSWIASTRKRNLALVAALGFASAALLMAASGPTFDNARIEALGSAARSAPTSELAAKLRADLAAERKANGSSPALFILVGALSTMAILLGSAHAGSLRRASGWILSSSARAPQLLANGVRLAARSFLRLGRAISSAPGYIARLSRARRSGRPSARPARPSLSRRLQDAALGDAEVRAALERRAISREAGAAQPAPRPPSRL